jgi:uncharacterized protein
MARNILRRFIPTAAAIKSNPALHFLGDLLHDPNLFHLNRHSVSVAFFVGLFIAIAIPLPGQMAIAAVAALYFRCNLPISVALVWVTNPFTIPFFFYFAYTLGCFVLRLHPNKFSFEFSVAWVTNELERLLPPFLLGSLILGLIFATLGYISMQLYWRWNVNRNWENRKKNRIKK